MSFIDWSDSEGLLGLLIEFIVDEKNESVGDACRQRFLAELLADLNPANPISTEEAIHQLSTIHDSIDQEFKNDVVVVHIRHCIEELERGI